MFERPWASTARAAHLVTGRDGDFRLAAWGWLACWLAAFAGLACHEPPSPAATPSAAPEPERKSPIEMFSWWTRVGEADAVAALLRVHRARHPGDDVINASRALSGGARKLLERRMAQDNPPDIFQANIGADLLRWVETPADGTKSSTLLPLNSLAPQGIWRSSFSEQLLQHVSQDGQIYAVPANLHRVNRIFYNKKLLAKHHLREPRSLGELLSAAQRLRLRDVPLVALGSREPWTIALLAFECISIAEHGAQFYLDYFQGKLEPDDPRIQQTLRTTLSLLQHKNPDHENLSWSDALQLVAGGKAVFTVMGDWARVSFDAHHQVPDRDYTEQAFPGTQGVIVYTSDTFALPRGAENIEGAKRLLATILSKEGQRAISRSKGSLTARTDARSTDLSDTPQHAAEVDTPMVLALSGLVPASFAQELHRALAQMLRQETIEPVERTLRLHYPLLLSSRR